MAVRKELATDEQGVFIAELALLISCLVTVMMGTLVFGLAINRSILLAQAARDAAREASKIDVSSSNPIILCSASQNVVKNSVRAYGLENASISAKVIPVTFSGGALSGTSARHGVAITLGVSSADSASSSLMRFVDRITRAAQSKFVFEHRVNFMAQCNFEVGSGDGVLHTSPVLSE